MASPAQKNKSYDIQTKAQHVQSDEGMLKCLRRLQDFITYATHKLEPNGYKLNSPIILSILFGFGHEASRAQLPIQQDTGSWVQKGLYRVYGTVLVPHYLL